MTILYSSLSPVKPTRLFGKGILRSLPGYRADHTAADEHWLAQDNARRETEDRRFDRMAADAEASRRVEAGLSL